MRHRQGVTDVWVKLFPRFADSSSSLQGRIKEMMVQSILMGLIPADAKVPPSRTLAQALGLSRNTVSLALQVLVDKGFLISRPRSGLFVNREILLGQANKSMVVTPLSTEMNWTERFVFRSDSQRQIMKPANWQEYRYPFIYGQFDPSLIPLKDWRACTQQTLLAPAAKNWSQDYIDRDFDPLIDQIQHRLLPARGILAKREEILLTAGAQMACYMLANLLLDRKTVVGIEDPGYPDARNNFNLRSDFVRALPIDNDGLIVSRSVGHCSYVYVTPSHQCPTTVTMSLDRRHQLLALSRKKDIVIFEDDHESELNYWSKPLPALKSLDTDGRVIYLGSLSKTLAHGLRIGFIVGPAALIRELRALRRLMMRHPSTNNAHTVSLFIAQGHHDAFIRKLNMTYRERREILVQAFSEWLPQFEITPSLGGSGAWIKGPDGLDCRVLVQKCADRGILIEPGDVFFNKSSASAQAFFRMGYSAINANQIRSGVAEFAQVCSEMGFITGFSK